MRQESIHPRVYYGANGVKKNTSKPRSRLKLERALAGIEKHLEAHPRDSIRVGRAEAIKKILEEMPRAVKAA